MTGWLIVNEYLNTEKFKELQQLFMDAAEKLSVTLSIHTNDEFIVRCDTGRAMSEAFMEKTPDFIIFYDKDISLAKALEDMGFRVYNCSDAIEACDSKAKTALYVSEYNDVLKEVSQEELHIRMPKTFKVPFTYENIGINEDGLFRFLDICESEMPYPFIIKESYSSFGMGVHLAKDRKEATEIISKYANRECIIQEYIGDDTEQARDVRLQMVGEECVCAMMRSNDHDFRANLTNGGSMSKYEPSEEEINLSVSVMRSIGLDFAGIDLMFDSSGKPVFCEANSNAHFKNLYDLTGINVAENIIKYVINDASEYSM